MHQRGTHPCCCRLQGRNARKHLHRRNLTIPAHFSQLLKHEPRHAIDTTIARRDDCNSQTPLCQGDRPLCPLPLLGDGQRFYQLAGAQTGANQVDVEGIADDGIGLGDRPLRCWGHLLQLPGSHPHQPNFACSPDGLLLRLSNSNGYSPRLSLHPNDLFGN